MTEKLRNSYKTISDVVKILNINSSNKKANQSHTIRYWVKEFKQIRPKIFAGKRRYYDQNTIKTLKKIKFLLKEKGFTVFSL